MKVCIFGASGATGRLLTERCLAAGHEVSVLLRRPTEFGLRDRVRVIEGNAFDTDAIGHALEGAEVVLSALGARSLRREDVLERAVPLIVEAMRRQGVRRIVALGSAGALEDSMKRQPAYQRRIVQQILYRTLLKWPVASQVAQWKTLSTSGLDHGTAADADQWAGSGQLSSRRRESAGWCLAHIAGGCG